MNSESLNFIKTILKEDTELVIEDIQNYIKTGRVGDERTFIFLNIISNFLYQSGNISSLLMLIIPYIENDRTSLTFKQLLEENYDLIKKIYSEKNKQKFTTKNLVDINWKLVGRASLEMAENGHFEPKIILNLIFSDGSKEVVETDFATFKKLQEELEYTSSSFNSGYSKKINAFSK